MSKYSQNTYVMFNGILEKVCFPGNSKQCIPDRDRGASPKCLAAENKGLFLSD